MTGELEHFLRVAQRRTLRTMFGGPRLLEETWVEYVTRTTHKIEDKMKELAYEDWVTGSRRRKWRLAGKTANCSDNRWKDCNSLATPFDSWAQHGSSMHPMEGSTCANCRWRFRYSCQGQATMDTLGGNDFIMGCLFLFIWQMMESLERLQAGKLDGGKRQRAAPR